MEMGPHQIPMEFQLLEAARSGNVKALIAALPPAADSQFPDHNNQTIIRILPGEATDAASQSEDVLNHTTALLSPAGETELSDQYNNHTAVAISIPEDATDGAHQSEDVNAPTAPVSSAPTTDHELSNYNQTNHAAKESEIIFGVTVGGNTVLHIAAEYGHLKLAQEVCRRAPSLVAAVNTRLETPLHCCTRAGHDQIVSLIIDTARSCRDGGAYGLLDVLRARNVHGETALHEACRFGHCKVSTKLIAADVDLATFVSDAGMSPLYLAVMRNSTTTVGLFGQLPCLSLLGPGGRTALHAAVSRSTEITTMLLTWKRKIAKFVDDSHSTPLHYVAADGDENMTRILLEHDPSTAYISDKDGYFPIHVAASMDHVRVIHRIMKQCPDSLELVDYNRRNFFHVAVVNKSLQVVKYVIRGGRGLEKLLNQRDNDGNTPLHLAVSHKIPKRLVYTLLRNRSVETSIMNNQGYTPLDLSYKLEPGIRFVCHAQIFVMKCLANCGAIFSPQRSDYAIQAWHRAYDPKKEAKKSTSLSRNLAIVSVLIATVTFAAGFTMPGGYRSDDGTSILTKKYPFKVFLISDACAMIFSLIATVQIIYAGSPFMDNSLRGYHIMCSICMLWISFACMFLAFGMASFAVVVPKAWGIGVLVCILTFIAPLVAVVLIEEPGIQTRCGRMRSNMDPHTRRRLQGAHVSFWSLTCKIYLLLLVYLVVFLLALL
ncbi:hypothetical protein J5N97_026428 [Dioscorea zingiberensis]|uniref:PGG domain-containing protein n=1 Tax=Dioscorea zingiberensis TaxID=325984 RepID=A0A9D5C2T0_9LILI|nr:hypothetical protein J5N97_026428 [Dioscorea zingiberensis]